MKHYKRRASTIALSCAIASTIITGAAPVADALHIIDGSEFRVTARPFAHMDVASQASQFALQQRGKPYVYGAEGPNAFDCSGLVRYVYKRYGINLPHSSYSLANIGRSIPVSSRTLKPGDILFFYNRGHVGIYIGNWTFVHAPQSGDVVRTASLSYVHPEFAKRVA